MKQIILASNSPRRSEILTSLNFPYKKYVRPIDEECFDIENPIQLVKTLAYEKANNVLPYVPQGSIILGADTIVVYNNQILTKPKDRQEAFKYLNLLSGNRHTVISGIALVSHNHHFIDSDETIVTMRNYSQEEINAYLKTDEPYDKAGAYAIQGMGSVFVEKINGNYYNVVGLPVLKLIEGLKQFDIDYFNSYLN